MYTCNKLFIGSVLAFSSLGHLSVHAAPVEIQNGGDNGSTTYSDGATTAGDTVVSYTDTASTPNTVNITSNTTGVSLVLPIEKDIRDITGKPLPNGTVLVKGSSLWYVLYVWNRTGSQTLSDVRLNDILPTGVSYAGQMDLLNSNLGGNPTSSTSWTTAASWSGLSWVSLTPGVDGDAASLSGNTLSLGRTANALVNVSAGNTLAIRFKVRIN